jgi:predicted ATP-grasp superfamily ATP-dependent carboligase
VFSSEQTAKDILLSQLNCLELDVEISFITDKDENIFAANAEFEEEVFGQALKVTLNQTVDFLLEVCSNSLTEQCNTKQNTMQAIFFSKNACIVCVLC